MASKKDNLRRFENVKIFGFDPNQDPDQYGRYSVALYISQEQRDFIDSYIYGKCELTKDNEIIYIARSKKPILFYDNKGNEIKEAYNQNAFIADVSLFFDTFINDKDETISYIKPIMIRFISKIENIKAKIFVKNEFSYSDCFESEDEKNEIKITETEQNDLMSEPPVFDSTFEPTIPEGDDLPF